MKLVFSEQAWEDSIYWQRHVNKLLQRILGCCLFISGFSTLSLGFFPMASKLHITTYNDLLHRELVIQLWESAFGYEAAHNKPSLVIAKKVALADDLFFLAVRDNAVLGSVMAGYDGCRGWLYSVAVSSQHQKQGNANLKSLLACTKLQRVDRVRL